MKYIIVILLLSSFSTVVSAQQKAAYIRGIIRDEETREAIAFASISIVNSSRGTAANERGEFGLLAAVGDESLKISSIGFVSKVVSIEKVIKDSLALIELRPEVKVLAEVEVSQTRIDPVDIIRLALDSVSRNYRSEPFNLEFYSEISALNLLTNQKFKVESIVLGFYNGYATNVEKKFEILKKRSSGDNPLKAMQYPFWPTLEIHRADLLSEPTKTGVLNEKYIDKFEYKFAGVLMYDSDTIFQIEYVLPKPTAKITGYGIVPKTYKGSVFISASSYAIVRHDIDTDQFSYSIIYKKFSNKYFPYFISGERRLTGVNGFSKVFNSVRLVSIQLENVKVIDYRTNEFENLDDLPDDVAYWELNYPVDDN